MQIGLATCVDGTRDFDSESQVTPFRLVLDSDIVRAASIVFPLQQVIGRTIAPNLSKLQVTHYSHL